MSTYKPKQSWIIPKDKRSIKLLIGTSPWDVAQLKVPTIDEALVLLSRPFGEWYHRAAGHKRMRPVGGSFDAPMIDVPTEGPPIPGDLYDRIIDAHQHLAESQDEDRREGIDFNSAKWIGIEVYMAGDEADAWMQMVAGEQDRERTSHARISIVNEAIEGRTAKACQDAHDILSAALKVRIEK